MTSTLLPAMNLDWAASLACLITAISFFTLHVISSPRKQHWMTLPAAVRLPLFVAGATFLYRAANLVSLAIEYPDGVGHITWPALGASVALSTAMASLTIHALSMAYSPKVWARLRWIHELASCKDRRGVRQAAVFDRLLTRAAVEELNEAGAVVAGPGEKWGA